MLTELFDMLPAAASVSPELQGFQRWRFTTPPASLPVSTLVVRKDCHLVVMRGREVLCNVPRQER